MPSDNFWGLSHVLRNIFYFQCAFLQKKKFKKIEKRGNAPKRVGRYLSLLLCSLVTFVNLTSLSTASSSSTTQVGATTMLYDMFLTLSSGKLWIRLGQCCSLSGDVQGS